MDWPRKMGWRIADEATAGLRGSVAVEFALILPILAILLLGVVDFGNLMVAEDAVASATRIGAEYAKLYPYDTSGIENAMQNSMSFNPSLTFPTVTASGFPVSCECDNTSGTPLSNCNTPPVPTSSCPAPYRFFIHVSASQAFAPGFTVNWTTVVRFQ